MRHRGFDGGRSVHSNNNWNSNNPNFKTLSEIMTTQLKKKMEELSATFLQWFLISSQNIINLPNMVILVSSSDFSKLQKSSDWFLTNNVSFCGSPMFERINFWNRVGLDKVKIYLGLQRICGNFDEDKWLNQRGWQFWWVQIENLTGNPFYITE